ncbi:ABC transporter ATP-binding protein [Herbiconiux sp. CPCC 203407]|uniref:ABC transporter ATP-binding protein n=1 Tax=Herbiconiux oxytropis TaxID=2970915 RepID=A0AA41XA86_9MICO|nr:ABC transporter ATP-binding protein [Herbiconiux oxytropis]MCS5721447.1 ABC transporter ATP-binding protein [Herbiconiux oxytropis]MCS5724524.1 ABC transporter ATP-binding protein [Herbiconiux oxytropis]
MTDVTRSGALAPRLQVDGLGVVMARSGTPVVQDVSFEVAAAQVMGLVGESGSGKSTVALSLLGYARRGLRIAEGTIDIAGTSVLDLSGTALRKARGTLVAYVPQDPASGLNPALTLGYQLGEAMRIHDEGRSGDPLDDRIAALLDEVRLPATRQLLHSYPHQVSGGQAQRVAIAMAFACRPRLVVLDEPTTGLDVTTQRHILQTIRRLAIAHDVSAVYVSHDLPVVAEIADDVAVMYAGRLVEKAPAPAIFGGARHPYTAGLLRAAPTPERAGVLVGIEGRPPRPGRWPIGCAFADRCARATEVCVATHPPLEPMGADHLARCYHPVDAKASAPVIAIPRIAPPAAGTGALDVDGLSAWYGDKQILHDVRFRVQPGSCLGIVGESGSGKTTLARCLAGLHSAWEGPVEFGAQLLDPKARRRRPEERRRIQYIFQNPHASLNPRMSVGENVEEPLRFFDRLTSAERRRKVAEVLEQVALGADLADRMPEQLSGGERQRVAVARALIVDPELLICDEITSALDVSVQALVIEQLRELQLQRGLTMVFITHNVAVVRSIAQDILVLEQGRVVETGPVEHVLTHPEHAYTKQLLADLPRFADAGVAS